MKIAPIVLLAVAGLLLVFWLAFAGSPSPHEAPQSPTRDGSAQETPRSAKGMLPQSALVDRAPSASTSPAGLFSKANAPLPPPDASTMPAAAGDIGAPRDLRPRSELNPPPPVPSTTQGTSVTANPATETLPAPIQDEIPQYEIPPGMRAPVVLLPEDRPLTGPIQAALDDVRREFDAAIASAADPADAWEKATRHADDRYRQLMGFDAYNQKTMQDARDAMRSEGLLPEQPAPQP